MDDSVAETIGSEPAPIERRLGNTPFVERRTRRSRMMRMLRSLLFTIVVIAGVGSVRFIFDTEMIYAAMLAAPVALIHRSLKQSLASLAMVLVAAVVMETSAKHWSMADAIGLFGTAAALLGAMWYSSVRLMRQVRDATVSKSTIRRALGQYLEAMNASGIFVLYLDKSTESVFANASAWDALGIAPPQDETMAGRTIELDVALQLMHSASKEVWLKYMESLSARESADPSRNPAGSTSTIVLFNWKGEEAEYQVTVTHFGNGERLIVGQRMAVRESVPLCEPEWTPVCAELLGGWERPAMVVTKAGEIVYANEAMTAAVGYSVVYANVSNVTQIMGPSIPGHDSVLFDTACASPGPFKTPLQFNGHATAAAAISAPGHVAGTKVMVLAVATPMDLQRRILVGA